MGKTNIPYLTHVCNAAVGCTSTACPHCWARAFLRRGLHGCPDCKAFKVHFHPERLEMLRQKKPMVVAHGFMGDLFDPERSIIELAAVVEACKAAPQHQHVFLTRQAERASEYFRAFAHPNWWLGVTVTGHSDTDQVRLSAIHRWHRAGVKTWLSLEPWNCGYIEAVLLEIGLGVVDFVALGSESGGSKTSDEYAIEWQILAGRFIEVCRAAKVPIFIKQIPVNGRCNTEPLDWPRDLQVQEVPPAWAAIINQKGD